MASLRRLRRIVEAETAYWRWQLETLARLEGDRRVIAWRQLDAGAIALKACGLPGPTYNRVLGLRGDLGAELEPLLAWYAEAGITPLLETISHYTDPALAEALTRRGYYQSGFQVMLGAAAVVPEQEPAAGTVEEVDSAGQLAVFLELQGWPAAGVAALEATLAGLRAAGISLYLRRHHGRPAAAAALVVQDGIGYCAPALGATAAEGGLDGALLARRLAAARAGGAEWVCSDAELLSARQASLIRLGFEAVFIRARWTSL
jgi:hypothetical protein